MMSATVMMTTEGPDGPQHKTAARIVSAGTRMDLLIGDLVDFTRHRLGSGIPVTRTEMDMETVCRQTVDEITAFHPRCVVNFKASGDLYGSWDSGRIAQAISNLCGNAFQHGSEDAPIDVEVRGEADHVVVTVHNTGNRIPKDRLHDIFNPFKQLDPGSTKPKNARSVGLGLYIVKAIVTAHEGTIDVESNEGGTTFSLVLPRTPHETGNSAATSPQLAVH
jgi:signal transduction histidine kinase